MFGLKKGRLEVSLCGLFWCEDCKLHHRFRSTTTTKLHCKIHCKVYIVH